MAINIFDATNNAPRKNIDVVGRFRAGHTLGKRPMSLSEWRVTSDDPSITKAIADLYGGESQSWDNERQPYEVFTTEASIPVIVERVFSSMTLWGRNGLIRRCDGQTLSFPEENAGEPCPECSKHKTLADRKEAAKKGTGCEPDINIRFRLTDAPDLGIFEFRSSSWSLAQDIGNVEEALSDFDGRAYGTLTLTPVEFTQKDTGLLRKFTKTVINLTEAAPEDEAAEELVAVAA